MIKIDNLVKRFGKVEVLNGINLEFPDKEFVTLVGPSGCGKTTLLRIIAGLEDPTSGDVFFHGKPVNGLSPRERDIAMVFQSYALYPHLNVAGNLGYALKLRGMKKPEIEARVGEVAEVLEITKLLARKPKELSGGQRQRVALGRAMVRKPGLFLMDEPLSNLDAKLRTTMRSELKHFHVDLGVTTVYVTHDQLEAMSMSDRIAVFDHGSVQQYGTPMEIYGRPNNLFVAEFMGSPPMNFLRDVEVGNRLLITKAADGSAIELCELPDKYRHVRDGTHCVLGVRPQDVALGAAPHSNVPGQIDLVQLLGADQLVEVMLDKKDHIRVTASLPADLTFSRGIKVSMSFAKDRIHLFDPKSTSNLLQ